MNSIVEWIAIGDRLPTKDDANYEQAIIVAFANGDVGWEPWDTGPTVHSATHWARFPALPKTNRIPTTTL